jgi:hypothetical protein
VRKGTVLTFSRGMDGRLTAKAGDTQITSVQSPLLCSALFDLYLGDQPVSRPAKFAAGCSFARMLTQEHYEPPVGATGTTAACPV